MRTARVVAGGARVAADEVLDRLERKYRALADGRQENTPGIHGAGKSDAPEGL